MKGIHDELMKTSKKFRNSTPRSRETTVKRVHTMRNKQGDYYKSSPSRLKEREKYLRESIKTVKVKRTKLKHWSKPLYEVVGR